MGVLGTGDDDDDSKGRCGVDSVSGRCPVHLEHCRCLEREAYEARRNDVLFATKPIRPCIRTGYVRGRYQ